MKFSGKTYDDIKSDSKTKLCFHFRHYVFLNIFLGLRRGFFLNETSVLVFLKLERASEKLVGKSLGKGYDASYVFWYLPNYVTYVKILAHVRRFYVDCQTLNLWKSPKNRYLFVWKVSRNLSCKLLFLETSTIHRNINVRVALQFFFLILSEFNRIY